jgi:hypothetical protein
MVKNMKVSEKIKKIAPQGEFRICPTCGYELGFHISFVQDNNEKKFNIILICPNCGARFNVGWKLSL